MVSSSTAKDEVTSHNNDIADSTFHSMCSIPSPDVKFASTALFFHAVTAERV